MAEKASEWLAGCCGISAQGCRPRDVIQLQFQLQLLMMPLQAHVYFVEHTDSSGRVGDWSMAVTGANAPLQSTSMALFVTLFHSVPCEHTFDGNAK
jgi:hypothetical protein